jgi:phenylacetate-CoA ligase
MADRVMEQQIKYVLAHSAFYQRKYGNTEACEIMDNFTSVPFTTKKEILNDQEAYPPYGLNLCVEISDIRRIHKTSGTTQKPVIIALTERDISHILDVGRRCFESCGLSPSNTVMHCLNFNMWAGGLTDCLNLEATGATVVPFGVGNTKGLIEMIKILKADAIHCTPSYLSKIEQVLKEEFNMKPNELGLKLGLFGAESGLQNPVFRQNIEVKWGMEAYNANYGMAEVLSIIASDCCAKNGLHYRAGEKLYVEIIDPSNGKSEPIEKGTRGEMVFTNLCKEAQPLIRYRSGDIVEIKDTTCSCGYEGFIFDVIGRSDDLLVVRGLNVFVSAIEKAVSRWFGHINVMYEILVSKNEPIEVIIIRAEKSPNSDMPDDELSSKIHLDLKNSLNISVEVELIPEGTIERVDGKTKRLKRVL